MNIGVFDSGRGGEFVASGLRKLLPQHEYIVVNDHKNVPYGSRSNEEVAILTDTAIQPLISGHCPIIVIACNTATMAAIDMLRAKYASVKFIGIEPMVKPAVAKSASGHITVLATPLVLQSERYQQLISLHATGTTIDQPNAAGWAAAIERNAPDDISFGELATSVQRGSDTIVLACTHYIMLKARMAQEFPGITVLEPTAAIARQITTLSAA